MTSAKDRYRTDPVFHRLVDILRGILHENQATPSELREALMLAAYIEEMENPGPALHRIDSLRRIITHGEPDPGEVLARAVCRHLSLDADQCCHTCGAQQ